MSALNPARTMGLFLRTWRAEWARLSRAQLAIAVSSRCHRRHHITPAIVRQWENGQPPQSSEELTALLDVMARHGLGPTEVDEFRRTVYAACAAHTYPDLLGDGGPVAFRRDIDEVARQLAEDWCCRGVARLGLVAAVAATKELEQALLSKTGPRLSPQQRRRLSVALPCFRVAVSAAFPYRVPLIVTCMSPLHRTNGEFLDVHFGAAGLGGELSVFGQLCKATDIEAHDGRSRAKALSLLQISEAAACRDDHRNARQAFLCAVHCLAELQEEGAYKALRAQALSYIAQAEAWDPPGCPWSGHLGLAWAALSQSLYDEVETYLARFDQWWGRPDGEPHLQWKMIKAWLAAAEGDWDTAEALDPPSCALARELAELGRPASYRERMRLTREQEDQKPRRADGREGLSL